MPGIKVIFLLVALVLAGMSAKDYFGNERKQTLRGRIWARMAVIFTVVAAYLIWRG